MRKQIFEKCKVAPGNIIIIQEQVYDSLSATNRKNFICLELSERIQVKDDASAKRLYFSGISYVKTSPAELAS